MVFTILNKTDLAPLMEIDDFISVVWNNKYYTAGEFEIVFQTTPERIEKVARDNFITLNGTDEIAIIDLITFTEDEEQGAIMTVKGSFAQSVLNRRIIWDKEHLAGELDNEVRNIINKNALDTADNFRSFNKIVDLGTRTGTTSLFNMLTDREPFIEMRQIQFTGKTAVTPGTLADGVKTGEKLKHSTPYFNISGDGAGAFGYVMFYASPADVGVTGKAIDKIFSNPENDKYSPVIFWNKDNCRLTTKTHGALMWAIFNDALLNGVDLLNSFSFNKVNNYYVVEFSSKGIKHYTYKEDDLSKVSFEKLDDQKPYSESMIGLTKEEYETGGFGVSIIDSKLYVRAKVLQASVDFLTNKGVTYGSSAFNHYILEGVLGYRSDEPHPIFNQDSILIYDLKQSEEKVIYPSDPFGWSAENYFYLRSSVEWAGTMYCEFIRSIAENNIYSLGEKAGVNDYIEVELQGDNVLDKAEELLELYSVGLKARYIKNDGKIYFDFYKGTNRSNNIVFAESLDNLAGYTVNLANGGANVALVYSKDGDKEYTGVAGAGAGVDRREIFVNKTDAPGYVGNAYTQQLEEEGKLTLKGVNITIESEIDANSYVYRTQYNVGDIVKLVIKDLGIEYIIRILEVREYQDENGYSIDLILGE